MKLTQLFVIALPVALFAGCQTLPDQPYAREVKRKPGVGGEIALKTEHRDEDRANAQASASKPKSFDTAPIRRQREHQVESEETQGL